ncbi:uncharacterized protein [Physcomitrium patens]|uniref:Isopenicillin N synthase-like Fe(2+) 2OG dioxygenase domain-containing protein n=1 Tax=Physcomitrium patens TaxID=3218 RepID=A0A2K1IRK9_PHYPA|nr:uncharacterized protein LOC112274186 isoform X1 [Physcomitrium patens]XP_024359193.1 uncharacterized protein LOC112274186 isoform X1 [Physcomitrium patens]XP_024359194.1 uncharacterized protein LOC112274186 isoform X1 [Physcomitrium patens]PNR31910.1 hypothetical protein PHYPA_026033 [Physcomitrium patens]|eukprot:XP_024359192.1 uncharacterized protein LOC112274186 isoform X1 [Physcomitrella patens]
MGACVSCGHDPGLEKPKPPQQSAHRSSSDCNGDVSKFGPRNAQKRPLLAPHPLANPKNLCFAYKNQIVSTVVSETTVLEDLNLFLLSSFGISDSTYVVSGILVTVTGPLMPFFMLPYLHPNKSDNPYPIVVALIKDFSIGNWGCAPDEQEQNEATLEWAEIEECMKSCGEDDEQLYSSSASALLAAQFYGLLRRYGYVRLRLPPCSPILDIFQCATASARGYFSKPEAEKRRKFLGFNQQKFVGYSHVKGSARQFIQLRTTKGKVTKTAKEVPIFDVELVEAYLALQNLAYKLFKLLCHPHLTPESHLSPELYSSLLDAPCTSLNAFNECPSVPHHQFIGTNVFRIYQYLREAQPNGVDSKDRSEGPQVEDAQPPGLLGAATTVHSDMGLLTVSPQSNLPGLTVLKHSDASRWVNVEMKHGSTCADGSDLKNYVFVFIGETLAQLTKGSLLAPLHFVDERTPTKPRFSMPFFLRARQKCVIPAVEGFGEEMTVEYFMSQVLQQRKQVWGHKPTTDF